MAASHVSAKMSSQQVAQSQGAVQSGSWRIEYLVLTAWLQACYCLHLLVNGSAETKMADLNRLGLSTTASSKHVLAFISNVAFAAVCCVFCLHLSLTSIFGAFIRDTKPHSSRQKQLIYLERYYTNAHFSHATRLTSFAVPVRRQAALHHSCHAPRYTWPDQ